MSGARCRCIKWQEGQPCCREGASEGAKINALILKAGCFALSNPNGDRVFFYPIGRIPLHLSDYLASNDSRRLKILRDYLLKL